MQHKVAKKQRHMLAYLFKKIKKLTLSFFSFCLFPVAFVLRMSSVRILGFFHTYSIGHFSLEPDAYLKQTLIGQAKKYKMLLFAPKRRLFSFYPKNIICNPCLADYWKNHYHVITSPYLHAFFFKLKCWKKLQYPVGDFAMNYTSTSPIFEIYKRYTGPSLIRLTKNHLENGSDILKQMGIPENAWYVCFHVRDHDYYPLERDAGFSCRNSDVNTLYSALKEIEEAGGWCIRMGDKKSVAFPERFQRLNHLIDYTKSGLTSDAMDLFLAKTCRFFIGGSSGLVNLPSILGTPSVHVNRIPFCNMPYSPKDIAIPKLYYSQKENRLLKFSEITAMPCSNYIHNSEFEKDEISLIENTEEEILFLVKEMLALLDGKQHYTHAQIELRKSFSSLFKPGNFCFGFSSHAGISFLEKYRQLF